MSQHQPTLFATPGHTRHHQAEPAAAAGPAAEAPARDHAAIAAAAASARAAALSPLAVRMHDRRHALQLARIAVLPPAGRAAARRRVDAYLAWHGCSPVAAYGAHAARCRGLPHNARLAQLWQRAVGRCLLLL